MLHLTRNCRTAEVLKHNLIFLAEKVSAYLPPFPSGCALLCNKFVKNVFSNVELEKHLYYVKSYSSTYNFCMCCMKWKVTCGRFQNMI